MLTQNLTNLSYLKLVQGPPESTTQCRIDDSHTLKTCFENRAQVRYTDLRAQLSVRPNRVYTHYSDTPKDNIIRMDSQ